jgi:hypothetical protein
MDSQDTIEFSPFYERDCQAQTSPERALLGNQPQLTRNASSCPKGVFGSCPSVYLAQVVDLTSRVPLGPHLTPSVLVLSETTKAA